MKDRIQAQRLNRQVTLLRKGAPVDDGLTMVPGAWGTLAMRFASIKPKMGREPMVAGTRTGEAVQSVWMRLDEVTRTLTERDAVEVDGQRFEIIAPPIEVMNRYAIEVLIVAAGPEE